MRLDDCLAHHARYRPDRLALVFEGQALTYAQLDARVSRLANVLVAHGMADGARVAILMPNHSCYVEVLFAAARARAILVPLNYRLSPGEMLEILVVSQSVGLISNGEHLDRLARHDAQALEDLVVLEVGGRSSGSLDLDELVRGASDRAEFRACPRDAPLLIQYTSGSTGKPKGVLSGHGAWSQLGMIEPATKRIDASSRFLDVLPMCHTGGLKWIVEVAFAGATLFIVDRFDPAEMYRLIETHRITNSALVPTMLYQMLDAGGSPSALASLRSVNLGGAPLSEARAREAAAAFGCEFTQGYGMTEMAGGTIASSLGIVADPDGSADGLPVGRPVIDCDVRIMDEDGFSRKPTEVGEIAVRSDRLFQGYWGESPSSHLTSAGFFRTGDLGFQDEAGLLYVVDRSKDMVISGGLNVYSSEVEGALLSHPAVAEAYVFGLSDPVWGEQVAAAVVAREGRNASRAQLVEWCRARLASYKKPRRIFFLAADEIPRGGLGKVIKHRLKERCARLDEPDAEAS